MHLIQKKKVMVYGSGNARDHATTQALLSPDLEIVCALKGRNPIIEQHYNTHFVTDVNDALKLANVINPNQVMVLGPTELIAGEADIFRNSGYETFGVNSRAAEFEKSKVFSKQFMRKYDIPTPDFYVANTYKDAVEYLTNNWHRTKFGYVIKTDIFTMNAYERTDTPSTLEEALISLKRLSQYEEKNHIILEEFVSGNELSVHVIVNKDDYFIMPQVVDYKKINSGSAMTHGVASVASSYDYDVNLKRKILNKIVEPTLEGIRQERVTYDSILYIGVMVSKNDVYALEYNVRSGNPEWLSLVNLLDVPLMDFLNDPKDLYIKKNKVVSSVYGLTYDYPVVNREVFPEKISGLNTLHNVNVYAEALQEENGHLYPKGGRPFAITAVSDNFDLTKIAIDNAFCEIKMDKLHYRKDIRPWFERKMY